MSDQLEIVVEGHVGVIRLNRPEAINALTPEMMTGIHRALQSWVHDEHVRLVLFEGVGERGFCAGGDVRWTRRAILDGRANEAADFFALEYRVNRMIATYAKPVVALAGGVVMGGGIGLAGHAKFRISAIDSRFAMPEGAIGFFADVGVQSLLARVVRQRALMFLLSGESVGAADAVALNLTDVSVPIKTFAQVRAGIIEAAGAKTPLPELERLMRSHQLDPGPPGFCQLADAHARCFDSADCMEIVARLEQGARTDKALAKVLRTINSRCPTSLVVHVAARNHAEREGNIDAVLARDLRLARLFAKRSDFIEGVRAVLVDKDQKPLWSPADLAGVNSDEIEAALAG